MLGKRYRLELATWTVVREPGHPPRPAAKPGGWATLSLPQAHAVVRDHQQSARQLPLEECCEVTPHEQEGGATTCRRRPKQDDARVSLGRMGAYIGDALVQRQ
jgi:hypothetical protein